MLFLKLFTYRLWLKKYIDMGERHLGITSSFFHPVWDKSDNLIYILSFSFRFLPYPLILKISDLNIEIRAAVPFVLISSERPISIKQHFHYF